MTTDKTWLNRTGETIEFAGYCDEMIRVHFFRNTVEVAQLANAGKRGKTVDVLHVSAWRAGAGAWANFLLELEAISTEADFTARVVAAAALHGFQTDVQAMKGVHVKPAGVEKIAIGNDAFAFTFGFDSFSGSDHTDPHNEPRYMSCSRTGQRGIAKAYKLAKAGTFDACETMHAVLDVLRDNGIAGHGYCGMD